jgi:hypothetical protein
MDQIEAFYLINQMRHRELLQYAEKQRTVNKIRSESTQTKNLLRTHSVWIRVNLLKKKNLSQGLFVEHGTTDPCCNMTQTQLR